MNKYNKSLTKVEKDNLDDRGLRTNKKHLWVYFSRRKDGNIIQGSCRRGRPILREANASYNPSQKTFPRRIFRTSYSPIWTYSLVPQKYSPNFFVYCSGKELFFAHLRWGPTSTRKRFTFSWHFLSIQR